MKLPRLAVSRPVTMLMGMGIIIILGIISLTQLPIDLLPNIEAPVIAVITNYSDAGPYEVENFVTRPIEESLGSVNNITNVSSTSSRGQSVVIAQFDWGIDMDFASLDVREMVDLVRPSLPDGVDSPMIMKFDPTAMALMQLVLVGSDDLNELRQIADDQVKNRLERLEGVASVSVSGGYEREIQVNLHPGLLRTYGVSIDSVTQALSMANLNLPAGNITDNQVSYILRTTGEFRDVEQISQVRIPTQSGTVPLSDVATVIDGFKEVNSYNRLNQQPTVSLSVQKEASANSMQVAERVHGELARLNQELSPRATIEIAEDTTVFIQDAVDNVVDNALLGGIFAMIVLFLFLRSIRSTVIIGIAIPISVLATFTLMYFSNISLNMISLGGLALGVGMLVDNAIVVLENVFRHREMGVDKTTAAHEGAQEVGTAISASTLTTVSVFVPVVFIAGIAAEIFRDMALTVTFSLLASLLISLTLVPMLSSRLLGDSSQQKGVKWLQFLADFIGKLQEIYGKAIVKTLGRRLLVLGAVFVLFIISLVAIPRVGMEFMPAMDQGELQVTITLPRGTPLDDTDRVIRQIEEYALRIPDAALVYASSGQGGSGGAHSGRVGVRLKPLAEREVTTDQVIADLREFVQQIPGIESQVTSADSFGMFFGTPIRVEFRGDDLDELTYYAQLVTEHIEDIPGVAEPSNSMEEGEPELSIEINRERAATYGVTVGQVASALRTAVSGSTATRYRSRGQEVDVTVRLDAPWRQNVRDIQDIPIDTARGVVPLREIASVIEGASPIAIERNDRSRVVAVTGYVADRDLAAVMTDIQREIGELDIPPHIAVEYGGQDEQMVEAFGQLALAMLLGIVLVYMILASQFESLLQPLIIMITLPLAMIGVVAGLFIFNTTFNVVGFVGAIMLAGIVVNNGIVLIDYVNILRRDGVERNEALKIAGERRLRPILMTSLTTILAMLPMALVVGEGQEMQQPIAVVVIGGLVSSTFLTLFVVPIVYSLLDDLSHWAASLVNRKARSNRSA